MVRVGARSKGCRLCRQRRIKCDEATPACTQCRTTGRVCPGPITGIIIRDMTLTVRQATLAKPTRRQKRGITNHVDHQPSLSTGSTANKASTEPSSSSVRHEAPGRFPGPSLINELSEVDFIALGIEKLGVDADPFNTLPLGPHFTLPKLIHHCSHAMGESLVALGPGNPMKEVWLPVIFSDQLLLQCTMYTSSVHMSSIYGIDIMYNPDVVAHRIRTLVLLNQRLANPVQAVNDITLTSVMGFLGQVIVCGNVQETTLHLDGIQKMLALAPSYVPNPNVREVLFWTDLIGSALCHTKPRRFVDRPKIRLYCHPLYLNPRSTIGILCRGFQKVLLNHGVFNSITDILHDLRCLTTVMHFSRCKAHSEMPLYVDMCRDIKQRLVSLPSIQGTKIFESCRLATMLFTELILLDNSSNAAVLAAGIKTTLEGGDLDDMIQYSAGLLLWILFIGNIAALGTELGPWFNDMFIRALSLQKLYHVESVRMVLIEFLWLEDVLNNHLNTVWTDVKQRINP
ncbi:hypothetical protein F5884DRAFT_778150 [Xylogone sp. PMI_703]|nr:hypothetical protein F5884DRAFT_778150 [Xylogone sp. PMI_703]